MKTVMAQSGAPSAGRDHQRTVAAGASQMSMSTLELRVNVGVKY